ncbi:MAG: hypothetical protein ABJB85_06075 [Nitrososphaerota archaeon]
MSETNDCDKLSSDSILEYIETQRDRRIPLRFERICPLSSGTMREQTEYHDPEGLTLVAFLPEQQKIKLREVVKRIKTLDHDFVEANNFHCTFLGLFPHGKINEVKLNSYYEKLVRQKISQFFGNEIKNNYPLNFNLEFNLIRPGTWHGNNNDRY